jgi:hypothetical protein
MVYWVNVEMQLSGVTEILLANYEDIASITLNAEENKVTDIAMTSPGVFYKFSLNRENASFADTAEINIPNGVAVYRPSVTFNLAGLDTNVRDTFKNLSQATVIAIAKSLDGTYYLVGKANGLDLATGSALNSGTAATDFQGATITLEGLETEPMIEIDSAFDPETLL